MSVGLSPVALIGTTHCAPLLSYREDVELCGGECTIGQVEFASVIRVWHLRNSGDSQGNGSGSLITRCHTDSSLCWSKLSSVGRSYQRIHGNTYQAPSTYHGYSCSNGL